MDQSLTTGVISALQRTIDAENRIPIEGVIQTDTAINPGNSGGPLLDSAGRLIGVNTAIASPTGAYAGIGFAIPVDTVNEIVPQLIRYGKIMKPGLGVTLAPEYVMERWGIEGLLIMNVTKNGPAAKAGLRPTRRVPNGVVPGDIILAIDNVPLRKHRDLTVEMSKRKVGDTVQLKILREDEELTVEVTLEPVQ